MQKNDFLYSTFVKTKNCKNKATECGEQTKGFWRKRMKLIFNLSLVASAVLMSANAMALQQMDDAALSATTGQDGISLGIGISEIKIDNVHLYDADGLSDKATIPGTTAAIIGGTNGAGALNISNIKLTQNAESALQSGHFADISIDSDAGKDGKSPFLNIGAAITGLNVELGAIKVVNASKDATTGFMKAGTSEAVILNGLSLKTGVTTANIQLGNTPQGAMIKLDGSMVGGLEINNLSLHDASSTGGGDLVLGKIKLNDTGSKDLGLNADVAVTQNGLSVTALKNKTDVYVQSIQLGSATSKSIGDLQVSGLQINNAAGAGAVITVSGH